MIMTDHANPKQPGLAESIWARYAGAPGLIWTAPFLRAFERTDGPFVKHQDELTGRSGLRRDFAIRFPGIGNVHDSPRNRCG